MSTEASSDIRRLKIGEREIILLGTAHISQDSVDAVRRLIEEEKPDTVCVELDEQRYNALKNQNRWESLNLIQLIRKKQVPFLMANLALSSFQKRMGLQTGVKPGAELAAAAESAEKMGLQVRLIDRDLRTTLLRAWRKTALWRKMSLLGTLVASLFQTQKLDEEELAKLRQTDTLSAMLEEMGDLLPSVKTILVDERDTYMAHNIAAAPGDKVVAVIGAAHMPGIVEKVQKDIPAEEITAISSIPEKPFVSKIIPWIIPAIVVGLFVAGFFFGDRQQVTEAAFGWILANGILAAVGTMIALGHPLTILSAFFAAPITSLNPTIGAGFVTGLVQTFVAAPTVRDMQQVGDDLITIRGWWSNRLARVFLVFFFSSLGSAAGTLIAFHWLKDLL
ncbi:MAG: TraB/GumN family protein [Desulfuromonadales bacterium]|nr:TraB/GumN family protein [Desulfuromonadales bacterium]NIR33539.1 TraB/GumN family protein [Desulfuromonadales bacterium]NIS41125.1 TraB/GumN family protein [Desulfuromonadales bacterium]